jgi:hypothetical protein
LNKRHNYRQVKRQREEARKTRQLQKQQRRSDREMPTGVTLVTEPLADSEPIAPVPTSDNP